MTPQYINKKRSRKHNTINHINYIHNITKKTKKHKEHGLNKKSHKHKLHNSSYTNIKSPEDIYKKFTNYAHYLEFELSKTTLNDIRNMIKNRKAIYNHNVDQRKNKFDGAIKLYKFDKKHWPIYLKRNYSKYKNWLV